MKSENIKKCRLYRGEKEYKGNSDNFLFWEAEKLFVETEGTQESAASVKFYLDCGLAGTTYDIPLELSACLFEVFCKGADNSPATLAVYFKQNFLPNYLALPQ